MPSLPLLQEDPGAAPYDDYPTAKVIVTGIKRIGRFPQEDLAHSTSQWLRRGDGWNGVCWDTMKSLIIEVIDTIITHFRFNLTVLD